MCPSSFTAASRWHAYHGLEMAAWMRNLLEANVARLENFPRK
jgi:hypothetical protein